MLCEVGIKVALFVSGFFLGFLAKTVFDTFTQQGIRQIIALVVTMVWVGSIAAEILIPDYTVAVYVHSVMGLVTGGFFGREALQGMNDTNIKDKFLDN